MTFLNPTILFGLLAAGIPILLHFLNLRKLKIIEFSSIKFLKELEQTRIKRIKFQRVLLLVIRILIVIFLVLAFARPVIKSDVLLADASSSKNIYIILDNSFSMGIIESNGSLFNQAKDIISDITREDETQNRYYIYTTTGDSLFISPEEPSSYITLNKLGISEIKGDINNSISRIIASEEREKNLFNELYIFTDFQKSNLDSALFSAQLQNLKSNNIKNIYLFDFSPGEINNRALGSITVADQIIRPGEEITISAVATNYFSQKVSNQTASLYINGNRRSLKSFDLEGFESKLLTFSTTLNDSHYIYIKLELEDDQIIQDNNAYYSLYVPGKIEVNVFSEYSENTRFTDIALKESGNITVHRKRPVQFNNSSVSGNVNILFVDNYTYNLSKLISTGERAIIFPGINCSQNVFNSTLSYLGMNKSNLSETGLLRIKETFFDHPVLKGLFEKEKNRLDTPDILKSLSRNSSSGELPIIALSNNTHLLSEVKLDSGKVLIFNTAPVLEWGNFPLKSIFAPLILKSVYYLSTDYLTAGYKTGQEILLPLNYSSGRLRVERPGNNEEFLTASSASNTKYLSYGNTETAGFYKFYKGSELREVYSVNVDPGESDNKKYSSESIRKIAESESIFVSLISKDDDIGAEMKNIESGSEIWRHLIFLALLLALVEMLVSKTKKSELATIENL